MSTKEAFDRANPNTIADLFRAIGIGHLLRSQIPQSLSAADPAADTYQLGTMESFGCCAKDAPAAVVHRAYAKSTTAAGTLGELAVQAYGVGPADGQIAVAPNGDIVVLAASAYDAIDLAYTPQPGKRVELELDVVAATGVCALPAAVAALNPTYLMEAEALVGGATGDKIILVPAGAAVAAGNSALNVAKSSVWFAIADAVTRARVVLWCAPDPDPDAVLESTDAAM